MGKMKAAPAVNGANVRLRTGPPYDIAMAADRPADGAGNGFADQQQADDNMEFAFPVLIADIGGTNARFALVEGPDQANREFAPVRIAAFETLEAAIARNVVEPSGVTPASIVIALAAPLVGERIRLTNGDWIIDPARLIETFGLAKVVLMNDFAGQGLATLALGDADLIDAGGGVPDDNAPRIAIGPGTGLGIAILVKVADRWTIIPGEGGHVDLGPRTQREEMIWRHLDKEDGRVSAECCLSGKGLVNLYNGVRAASGKSPAERDPVDPAEVSRRAKGGGDTAAAEAVELFVTLLARVAGDMAILTLARGGVYIAGGIGLQYADRIATSAFRDVFEDKAPHNRIMASIPVRVMTHPTAALQGLGAWVRHPQRFAIDGAVRVFGNA